MRNKKVKTYRVKVSYTFDGYIDIRTTSKRRAVKNATTAFMDPPEIITPDLEDLSPAEDHEGNVDCSFKLNPKKTHIR
jgi:hypothetical protein